MLFKVFFTIVLFLCFSRLSYAQLSIEHLELGVESQFLIGGEMNASYDFLIGTRADLFFKRSSKFQFFTSLSGASNIPSSDSRIYASDFLLGTYWNKHKKFSLFGGLGVHFMHEQHGFNLLEGKRSWQKTSNNHLKKILKLVV